MSSNQEAVHPSRIQRIRQERGAILIFVALGLVVLIGMMGLAIDLGHAYVNKVPAPEYRGRERAGRSVGAEWYSGRES